MKNAINYYYNIQTTEIHRVEDNYELYCFKKKYILYNICNEKEKLDDILKLYNLIKVNRIFCHEIIANKDKQLISRIEKKEYCLIRINIETRNININDIEYYMKIPINNLELKKIKKEKWNILWIKKMDYIEYQTTQFRMKYNINIINIDYYTGVVENCISMLYNLKINSFIYTINHERINRKTTTDEFYNPLKFILDSRMRDIGEYIKDFKPTLLINELEKITNKIRFSNEEIILLLTRIMYPSNFFDSFENNISKNKKYKPKTKEIHEEIMNLKKIYNSLKKKYALPEIEWLK